MSYTKAIYHIIFRTKFGTPTICEENEKQLYNYIWGIIKELKCDLYQMNGMPDHLHLLVDLHPMISIGEFVQKIKISSHNWIDQNKTLFPDFYAWSIGYCALTYSELEKEKIKNYIKKQKEHHKSQNFMDETKFLLTSVGIEINEKYFERDI